eukprot:8583455-Alexandrium_andersonii.AAC.1
MSASLVGSEMCIRDRVEPIIGCRDPTPGNPGPPWYFVFKYYNRVPVYAVSYTHLTLPTICSV